MKKMTLFYLRGCPYCDNARKALAELTKENDAYAAVEVDWVEESERLELANNYDYYYVPTIFAGEKKLYEADPSQGYVDIKQSVKAALDAVCTG